MLALAGTATLLLSPHAPGQVKGLPRPQQRAVLRRDGKRYVNPVHLLPMTARKTSLLGRLHTGGSPTPTAVLQC